MVPSCKTISIIEVPCGTQFIRTLYRANGTFEENLMQSTECYVVQEVDVVDLTVRYKMPNHYKVLNQDGEAILDVEEESGDYARRAYGPNRELFLQMYDMQGQRVMSVHRLNKCCSCRSKLKVEYPAGCELASIELTNGCRCCNTPQNFNIDSVSLPPMHIVGPEGFCPECCSDEIYNVEFSYTWLH